MTPEERARAVVDGWMLQAGFSQPAFITDLKSRIAAAIREAVAEEQSRSVPRPRVPFSGNRKKQNA